MKKFAKVMFSGVLAALLLCILAGDSNAYLDPGSGSYLLQLALAALFGVLLSVKVFWNRIRAFFTKRGSKAHHDTEADETD